MKFIVKVSETTQLVFTAEEDFDGRGTTLRSSSEVVDFLTALERAIRDGDNYNADNLREMIKQIVS